MFYGQNIYSDENLYGQSLGVVDKFVEFENDIKYYVFKNRTGAYSKDMTWQLYKYQNNNLVLVTTGNVIKGEIKINLNSYNLQYIDNRYLLRINQKNLQLSNNIFWYYFGPYAEKEALSPYYIGSVYIPDDSSTAGAAMAAFPIYKEPVFPEIHIKKIFDEDEKTINIIIGEIDSE